MPKTAPTQPQSKTATKAAPQSNASTQTKIPTQARIPAANKRIPHPLPGSPPLTPQTKARQSTSQRQSPPKPKPPAPELTPTVSRSPIPQRITTHSTSSCRGAALLHPIPAKSPNYATIRFSPITRLTTVPTTNVTQDPIITYQVNATSVNRKTNKIVANPKNIPITAPKAFARRSRVPNKNKPNKLPSGKAATVNPASNNGPHFTNPNPIKTKPQKSVICRERRKKSAGSAPRPASREKSKMLEAAKEFKDPLAFDIATATIEASNNQAKPTGISRTKNKGKIRSVRSPPANSGVCCAKTYSKTPINKNTVNCTKTIAPLAKSARRPSR